MNELRLEVSIDDQRLRLFRGTELEREYVVSTATKGVGYTEGSYRTPTGRFVIVQKIGDGQPSGTIFKARQPVGQWQPGDACDQDLVLTRIVRISGLQPESANTFDRFIYFHGTNQEEKLGTPASCGCIRLSNTDIIDLHDRVEPGTMIEILPPTKKRGKLIFFDCDSTLSSIEGIDELARAKGPEVFKQVVALTNAAMNGEIPLDQVFPKRMEIIRPDKATCAKVAAQYIKTVVPGAALLIRRLKKDGWLPVIISGGFAPLIEPLAKRLGIDHVEAVPLYLDAKGNYAGYGTDYPTTRNLGKNEIIREWKAAMLPERVGMMGDGISDLETKSDVDVFIGFGGVVKRPLVRKGSRNWIESLSDQESIIRMLGKPSKRHVSRTDKILSRQISKKTLSGDRPGLISAPMSTSSKKTSKGKRYSAEEKGDIVAFVEKHNAENGRGGQSAAAKKFGISQLTIASWLKSGGASTGAKRGRKPGSGSAAKGGSFTAKLGALSALAAQIDKAEADLDKLKAKFKTLKAGL